MSESASIATRNHAAAQTHEGGVLEPVINGTAVPVLVGIMLVVARRSIMGDFVAPKPLKLIDWLATIIRDAAAIAMIVLSS